MKTNILILLCFGILSILPNQASADCDDFTSYTSWGLKGTNTVVLYAGTTPVGQFDVQSCDVGPKSTIQLLKTMVCDGDDVMIDGSRCTILGVTSLN